MNTQERILKSLKQNPEFNQKALSKLLNLSEGTISYHIKIMEKQGKIQTSRSSSKFLEVLSNLSYSVDKPPIPISHKLSLRLHRLQRSYELINAVSEQKLSGLRKNLLNNNHQWIGKGFRITTKHLELEGIELWSSREMPAAMLEGIAKSLADNLASSLASQYGFSIDMEHPYTPPRLTEIELTQHAMAEFERQKGIIELYKDKEGYTVWMDKSFGLGGLESNKTAYIQKLTDMTNDIVEHDGWEEMKRQTLINAQQIGQLTTQLNIHAPYLVAWKKVADATDNPTKRARAQHAIDNLKQRRLE